MIQLTFLYDEYIDRPKLTEQKNPFEYIVPQVGGGTKINLRKPKELKYIIWCLKADWLSVQTKPQSKQMISGVRNLRRC